MNIVILGGDGFIGSHLAQLLESQSHVVYVVDKADLRSTRSGRIAPYYIYRDLSINTAQSMSEIIGNTKPDFIFNCVAVATPHYYVKYPIDTFNLDFSVNYDIIKSIIHHKIPFMHFSSSEVYGKKWESPYQEDITDLTIGPTHKSRWIYATSKIMLEQLIKAHNCEHVIVRPQNFFGWDMDWLPDMNTNIDNKWKPRLPACILNGLFSKKPLQIVLPGTQKRCYTYIDDAIEGLWSIVKCWDSCKNQTFNVGNKNNEINIENFIRIYKNIWNYNCPNDFKNSFEFVYVSGNDFYGEGYEDCERRMFDDTKMRTLANWMPRIALLPAIEKTVQSALINYKDLLK